MSALVSVQWLYGGKNECPMRKDRYFRIDRDTHFMSAYPNAMTGLRCEKLTSENDR